MAEIELSEGVTYEELSGPLYEKFKEHMLTMSQGFVRLQPYNQVMPRYYLNFEKKVKEFPTKVDDVWVASFPKCGTTWTQEMVWCIMNGYDYKAAKASTLDDRVPFFELSGISEAETGIVPDDSLEKVANMAGTRVIKTHLSYDMLPSSIIKDNVKIIYVTRNPRDTCVSFYNFVRIAEGYQGMKEEFVDCFLQDIAGYYAPFLVHVLSYWNRRHLPNVCFITYEEMKADLPSVVSKVASFLGKPLPGTQGEMEAFLEHLSFDKMKKNAAVNKDDFMKECIQFVGDKLKVKEEDAKFMRKGQAGDWKNHFSADVIARFQEWERKGLEGSGLEFCYEV